ncbi:MAG: S9 family peptidase, partial [Candidatus Thermoplasmatota archaeon]|nr:S9 family peptidase [Candidatus Thermoplasmatota archaeon]
LYKLEIVNGCQISPDGSNVAFSVQRVDRTKEKKYSSIYLVPISRGKPRQFTFGDQTDHSPRWSPDGKYISFLSDRRDEKQFQLYRIPLNGGEAMPLTDLKGTFSSFQWSPDGKSIAFSFRKKDQEALDREQDPKKKELGVVYRHYDKVFYKSDGEGFHAKEHFHVYIANVGTGKVRQITQGSSDEMDPTWSPDGRSIAYLSNRAPDPGLDHYLTDVYTYDLKKKKERALDLPEGEKAFPRFSPDGKWISYSGRIGPGKWWRATELFITRSDGKGEPFCLTKDQDITLDNLTLNDVQAHPATSPPTWSSDGSFIYFQTSEKGRTKLAYIDVKEDGHPIYYLVDEDAVVGEFSLDGDGQRIAFHRMDMTDPGNIWVIDTEKERWNKVTSFNELITRVSSTFDIRETWIKTEDGTDIQGWIMTPPGSEGKKKLPSILEIHGGPMAQYGFTFMHEFFYLASRGYVVHFCNPRGSKGYGEGFTSSIWKVWGTVDYDDVMAWTDHISKVPYIDNKRMCVTGGSYGGYMTNLIIGRSDRFKAAVSQRSVSNLISMWGSSDLNWVFQEEFAEVPPWEDLERYWNQSPMKFIKDAKTPTLIIHSENDMRCDIEQGEQIYVALKKLGVETEFLRFPDEPHGLSRMGRTDRRVVRLQHIFGWFDRFIRK